MDYYTIHLYTESINEECKKHCHNTGKYILEQLPSILLICLGKFENGKKQYCVKKNFQGIDKKKTTVCYSNYEKSQLVKCGFTDILCIREEIKGEYSLSSLLKTNFNYVLPKPIEYTPRNYKLEKDQIKLRLINITYFLTEVFQLYKRDDLVL
jgi:hypothetical protein